MANNTLVMDPLIVFDQTHGFRAKNFQAQEVELIFNMDPKPWDFGVFVNRLASIKAYFRKNITKLSCKHIVCPTQDKKSYWDEDDEDDEDDESGNSNVAPIEPMEKDIVTIHFGTTMAVLKLDSRPCAVYALGQD